MEINQTTFRDTLHKIPFSQEAWKDLISLLKTSTDSQAGIMMITRDNNHDILDSYSPDFSLSQDVRCAFEESKWITAALPEEWQEDNLSKGVVLGTDIIPQQTMRNTPFYQNILSTLGLEYLMAGVSLFGNDYRTLLKFFRSKSKDNFTTKDISALSMLMPEIRQMMRFTERLYERMVIETAEHKVNAPRGAATIIVDKKGKVAYANQAAESLLKEESIIKTKNNLLFAQNNLDNNSLSDLVKHALGKHGTAKQGCTLIGESSDAGVHQLLTLPVPCDEPPFPWIEELKVAAVIIIDPMREVKISPNILKALYGITPAEIDLVNAMANGIKPTRYAELVDRSITTIQTQRQAVFQKVGVKSQLELMSVLRDLTTSFEEMIA